MSNKRQRTTEQMAERDTQRRDGRRGESAVGGTLRLDISSCLKPAEAEILGIMLEAVKLSKSGTVVRVAGGWVRDKLLGLEVNWRLTDGATDSGRPSMLPTISTRFFSAGCLGVLVAVEELIVSCWSSFIGTRQSPRRWNRRLMH